MTAPERSFNTNFGRFYAHPSSGVTGLGISALAMINLMQLKGPNAPKPSVTNVIKVMDEGFLPGYHAKLVAEHAVSHLDAIRDTVAKFGDAVAIGALKAVPSQPHPAGPIGDEVHAAIDKFHEGEPIPELTTITARRMFARYLGFVAEHKPEVIRTEFTCWSYKYGYAGTGDLLWRFRGGIWIVDTKTGARVYPKVAMQNAALANADVIITADGDEIPMVQVDKIGCLHVRPMSARLYELQHADMAFAAFLGLKTVFDWMRYHKELTVPEVPILEALGTDAYPEAVAA